MQPGTQPLATSEGEHTFQREKPSPAYEQKTLAAFGAIMKPEPLGSYRRLMRELMMDAEIRSGRHG